MPSHLLVPIALHALPTTGRSDSWAAPTTSKPFSAGTAPADGVMLRWILPDALCRSVVGKDDKVRFPSLPDSWLILRFSKGAAEGDAPRMRSWLWDAMTGKAFKLTARTSGLPQLTAIGLLTSDGKPVNAAGELRPEGSWEERSTWAAFAPDAEGCMGILDDLLDADGKKVSGMISYVVLAWYSDPSRSPLLEEKSGSGPAIPRADFLGRSGWTCPIGEGGPDFIPRLMQDATTPCGLCLHGQLVEVDLNENIDGKPVKARAALGESVAAAVSLLEEPGVWSLGTDFVDPSILAALMAHAPENLDAVGTATALADVAEERMYGRKEGVLVAPNRFEDLCRNYSDALGRGLEGLGCPTTTARSLLRLDWERLLGVLQSLENTGFQSLFKDFLDLTGSAEGQVPTDWAAMVTRCQEKRISLSFPSSRALAELARRRPGRAPDRLVPGFNGKFAAPPVVTLAGAGRSLRHGYDHRYDGEKLRVRLSGILQCATHLQLGEVRFVPKGLSDLVTGLRLPSAQMEGLGAALTELIGEAMLMEPLYTGALARQAISSKSSQAYKILRKEVEYSQRAWWAGRDPDQSATQAWKASGLNGTRPSVLGLTPWMMPWDPVLVEYRYTQTDADGSLVSYSGRAGLTQAAVRALEGGMASLDTATPELLAQVAGLDLLTATLDGVPDEVLTTGVSVATKRDPKLAAGRRGPTRSGELKLTSLRILDGFGRALDVKTAIDKLPLPTRPLRPTTFDLPMPGTPMNVALLKSSGTSEVLPKRSEWERRARAEKFGKGSRRGPDNDSRVDPRGTLLGWLVPDRVDHAVELVNVQGATLGQLRRDRRKSRTIWDAPPGRDPGIGEEPTPLNPGSSAEEMLCNLAKNILVQDRQSRGGPSALSALMALIDVTRRTTRRVHNSSTPLGLLVGQPIAVISTSIRLLMQDAPAGWKVDAQLGDPTDPDDGLVGWLRTSELSLLHSVHAEVYRRAAGLEGAVDLLHRYVHPELHGLRLSATDKVDAVGEKLILLVIPGRSVVVQSDILPRQTFSPVWEPLLESLKRYAPSFRVGPVLSSPTRIALPGPAELDWVWKERLPQGWKEKPVSTPNGSIPDAALLVTQGWMVPAADPLAAGKK